MQVRIYRCLLLHCKCKQQYFSSKQLLLFVFARQYPFIDSPRTVSLPTVFWSLMVHLYFLASSFSVFVMVSVCTYSSTSGTNLSISGVIWWPFLCQVAGWFGLDTSQVNTAVCFSITSWLFSGFSSSSGISVQQFIHVN